MAHSRQSIVARTSSAGNPITASVTAPAGCTVMVVLLDAIGASLRAGGSLTWGEFTLTAPAQSPQRAAASPEASAEIWYLLNPPVGVARTLTIPNTGGLTIKYTVEGGSASGGGGTSVLDASNGGNATSANPTPGAMTITEAGGIAWAIAAGGWTSWNPSAQVGTIIANTDDGSTGGGEQYTLPSVGSLTLSWTFGTSDDWGAVAVAFKEIPPPNFENYKGGFDCVSAGVISIGEKIR